MKLHVLIDNLPPQGSDQQHAGGNRPSSGITLACEHGLSFLLQTPQGENYLIDTGASGGFVGNMQQLKNENPCNFCNIEEIDGVFISHGHNDHTGGLRRFIESNTSAPIWLHGSIQGNWFFSCRPKNNVREARSIGMEQSLFAEYGDRFVQISEPTAITGNITLIPLGDSACTHPMPLGNRYLYKNDFPDDFSHEVAILIEFAPQEYAIISPCSHRGLLNILEVTSSFCTIPSESIRFFIGGLHYVDYLGEEDAKKEAAQIVQAAEYIRDEYPYLKLVSGHCTCAKAGDILKSVLGNRYDTFCSGFTIPLL